jgi:hypothetical protein
VDRDAEQLHQVVFGGDPECVRGLGSAPEVGRELRADSAQYVVEVARVEDRRHAALLLPDIDHSFIVGAAALS